MTPEDRVLLERAVKALETIATAIAPDKHEDQPLRMIADALWSDGESVNEAIRGVRYSLETEHGRSVADVLNR